MGKKRKQKRKQPNIVYLKPKAKVEEYQDFFNLGFFVFTIFYFECLLHFFTTRIASPFYYVRLFCLSLLFGIVVYFLSSLSKTTKGKYYLRMLWLVGLAVLFLVHYFIFLQFKVFYDVNTVVAGAGGVVTGFYRQIGRLLGTPSSLFKIFLFFLPAIIYALLHRFYAIHDPLHPRRTNLFLICFLLIVMGIYQYFSFFPHEKEDLYERYNFQNVISKYGLLTGLGSDISKLLFKEEGTNFEVIQEEEIQEEEPVTVYEPNQLDINFEKLAKETTGTLQELNAYVATQKPSLKNEYTGLFKGKNLIFITAEAFTKEVIDKDRTPTLYRLATKGIQFLDYYKPTTSGTTGGEYENIFGMLPTLGGASMKKTASFHNYFTMGSQLNRLGYEGWAFHNNDYTFYDRHITHNQLGYSHGYMAYGNGLEEYITDQWPQSDLEMLQATVPMYLDHTPFNIYYMSVSGHNGYTYGENRMSEKHWDAVKDLPYSERVKGYLAANLELEDALTYLLEQLEQANLINDTVIVVAADHFPYGLDEDAMLGEMPYLSELYGYPVDEIMERDHNQLILWCGVLEDKEPIIVDTPTSSLDILPTLSNLFGLEWDSRLLPGRDVFSNREPLFFDLNYNWKSDKGTYNGWTRQFIPKEDAIIPVDYVERMNAIVQNKIQYCKGCLQVDYFGSLFE